MGIGDPRKGDIADVITGVECIDTIAGIEHVAPQAVKLRRPWLLGPLLQAHPGVQIVVTRPESEGLDAGAMIDGYRAWHQAFAAVGRMDLWGPHELSNEINHEGHDEYWQRQYAGIASYAAEAISAINALCDEYGAGVRSRLRLGGLTPFRRTGETVALHRTITDTTGVAPAAHAYFQGRDQVEVGLWEGWLQVYRRPGRIITEMNDSSVGLDMATRTDNTILAFRRAAEMGFAMAILFALDPWVDPLGVQYAYSHDQQRRILEAVA